MRKWEAEDALRKHIEKETGQRAKCDGDPTLQWFWENAYLPSRTWGPAMISTVTSIVDRHVLPRFGQTRITDLDKLELQKHLNALAESFSRSLVKKVLAILMSSSTRPWTSFLPQIRWASSGSASIARTVILGLSEA